MNSVFFITRQEKNMLSVQLLQQNINDKCNTGEELWKISLKHTQVVY